MLNGAKTVMDVCYGYDMDMIRIWIWYGYDMSMIWIGYEYDMDMIWKWYSVNIMLWYYNIENVIML